MTKRNVVHVEIPVLNSAESQAFYSELCGWKFSVDETVNYTMFEGNNIGGGLVNPDDDTYKADSMLLYLESTDVEADLKKVEALGGKTIQPRMEISDYGAIGVFIDPAGNRVAFWEDNVKPAE